MIAIYSLYKITNLINGKVYIGVTNREPEIRFREHKRRSSNSFISKAIQKYGVDNFNFEVILNNIREDEVSSMECHYIKKYNSLLPNGYNADLGGIEFRKHSQIIKDLISEKGKGINNSKHVDIVQMFDCENNLLGEFESAREAARFLGNEGKNVGINRCLRGKQRVAYGHVWKYKNCDN